MLAEELRNDQIRQIGKRIQAARKQKNMTQFKLAELAEISLPHMSNIECGKANISALILKNIAEVLQVSSDTLLCIDTPEAQTQYIKGISELLHMFSSQELEMIYSILLAYIERTRSPKDPELKIFQKA